MAKGSPNEVGRIYIRVVPKLDGFREKVKKEAEQAAKEASGKDIRFDSKVDARPEAKRAAKEASGQDVDFDTDLDAKGLKGKAKAAAVAASGHDVKFGIDIDRTSLRGLRNTLARGFSNANVGNRFDFSKVNKSVVALHRGLALIRRQGDRVSRVLTVGFNGFGRTLKYATSAVEGMGRSVTKVRDRIGQDFRDIGRELGWGGQALTEMVRRSQGDRGPGVMTKTFQRMKKDLSDIGDEWGWIRQATSSSVRESRLLRNITETHQKTVRGLRTGYQGLKGDLRNMRDEWSWIGRSAANATGISRGASLLGSGFQRLKKDLRDIRGEMSLIPDIGRKIGQSDVWSKFTRQAQRAGTAVRSIDLGGVSTTRRRTTRLTQMVADATNADRKVRGLSNSIRKVGGSLRGAAKKSDGFFKQFRQKYFQPDSTIGFIVVAITAAIAPLAGLIGSLMAGLPTLLASVGAAALVVALGFEGIKDAAKPLVAALEPLKKSLSDVFRENMTPQFEKLASVLPAFQGNLEHVARGLTVFSGAFVDAFTRGDNVQKVNTLLARTGNLFASMSPGMASFTDGFLTMFEGASQGYPAMAKVFNGFADLFSQDMSALVNSGSMKAAMESLATVTGSLMTGLHRIFVAGIRIMPQMTKGFTDMFDGIANGIITALPALAKFSSAAGTGIGAVFEGMGKGIATLGNYLSSSSLGAGISSLFQALAPAIGGVSSAVMEFVGVIGDQLGETLVEISPAIAEFASALSDKVGTVLQELAPAVGPVISIIGSLVTVILEAASILLAAFGPAIQTVAILIGAIAPAVASVIDWFARLLVATSDIWGPILVGVAAVIAAMKLWAVVTTVVIAVKGALTAAIAAVRTAMWFLNAAFYANPIGFVVAVVIAAVAAFLYLSTATDAGREAINRLNTDLAWLRNIISLLMPVFGALIWLVGKFNDFMGNSSGSAQSFTDEISGVTDSLTGMTAGLNGIPTTMDFTGMGLPQLQTDLAATSVATDGLTTALTGTEAATNKLAELGAKAQELPGIMAESGASSTTSFLGALLPGFDTAVERTHQAGIEMRNNMAGVALTLPSTMDPIKTEFFGLPGLGAVAGTDTASAINMGLHNINAEGITYPIQSELDGLPQVGADAGNDLAAALNGAIDGAAADFGTGVAQIPESMTTAGAETVTAATTAMTDMNTGIQTGVDNAGTIAGTLVPTVKGAIGDTNALHSSGLALGNSFAAGIRASIANVRTAAGELAAAAKANMPNSPAKEGPLSGRGYTTYSGEALAKDFGKGISNNRHYAADAAADMAEGVQKAIEDYQNNINSMHDVKLTQPIMEANAKKIADFRKREAEAHEKGNADLGKLAEDRQKMLDSLESPDLRDINSSFRSYYIDGTKEMMQKGLLQQARDTAFTEQLRRSAMDAVGAVRTEMGDHPVLAGVEANVNADHFEWAVNQAIEDSGIGYIPIELGIANLEQFKSDLGFGDGVISRGLTAALDFDPNNSDAHRYDDRPKEEVHYHVSDMEEAIRLENERRSRQSLRFY